MKLTKARLKQIIKEETNRALNETRGQQYQISPKDVAKAREILSNRGAGFGLNDKGELVVDDKYVNDLVRSGVAAKHVPEYDKDWSHPSREDMKEATGRELATQALAKAGISKEPEQVRKDIHRMLDLIDTDNPEELDSMLKVMKYLMKTASANVTGGLGLEEGVVDMDGETIVTGPDGDASPLARAGARQDDLRTTMMKAAMEIKDNKPQQAYETLLRALAAAGIEDEERLPGLGDELDEMYAGYSHSRGGARGSSYSGFPPAQARDLAKRLAAMSRNRTLSYGDEKALNAYVGKQKYSTSREAKEDIIKYLVGQRFGNRADYR